MRARYPELFTALSTTLPDGKVLLAASSSSLLWLLGRRGPESDEGHGAPEDGAADAAIEAQEQPPAIKDVDPMIPPTRSELLSEIFAAGSAAMVWIPVRDTVSWNGELNALLRVSFNPGEVARSRLMEHVAPEDAERVTRAWETARTTGTIDLSFCALRGDESRTTLRVRGRRRSKPGEHSFVVTLFETGSESAVQPVAAESTRHDDLAALALTMAPIGAAVIDPAAGSFTVLNEAFARLMNITSSAPKPLWRECCPSLAQAGANEMIESIRNGEFEERSLTFDLNGRSLEARFQPLASPGFPSAGIAIFVREGDGDQARERAEQMVASERAARARAENATRMSEEFLSTISHELRTPLNAILGWSQLLLRGKVESDRAGSIIEQNARTQAQLIDDLVDVSRMLSGNLRLNPELTPPGDIVWAAASAVRLAADEKGVSLNVAIPSDIGLLEAEPARLKRVVTTLLQNAVKATPAGGKIALAAVERGQTVEISIAHNGEGLAAEELAHLFDRYGSPTKKREGAAIGLVLAHHLVSLHGGSLHAESRGKDQGSTFIITLPLAVRSGDTTSGSTASAVDQIMFPENVTILVVDDEPHAVELLKHILSDRGARVVGASSAQEALHTLDTHSIDLLISDIGMPEMDGYSLIRAIRSYGDHRSRIPAIALTAFVRAQDKVRALESGFTTHLTKPVDVNNVVKTVSMLLSEHGPASTSSPFAM